MSTAMNPSPVRASFSDLLVLCLVGLGISLALYHRFYFGDELFSFAYGLRHKGSFWGVFGDLNAYKPRVVMNALWAAIVAWDLPRWIAMLVNAAGLAGCASLAYWLAIKESGLSRLGAVAVGALVLLSRFNVMLYYDYVSGTVETLSLFLFLAGIASARSEIFTDRQLAGSAKAGCVVAMCCFVLAVLVHERYVAGLVGIMSIVLVSRVMWFRTSRNYGKLIFPVMAVVAPVVLFGVLVKTLSDNPLAMGTSGQVVTIGAETVKVAVTYAANVFLGTNFGPPWFVGLLNQDHPWATRIFCVFGVVSLAAWTLPWLLRRNYPASAPRISRSSLAFLAAAIGMIAVASLPGSARQEARWMYPVYVMVLLFAMVTYRGWARHALIGLLAAVQFFYLAFGSVGAIASITASNTAKHLGNVAETVELPGTSGLLLAVPEPDTSWVLGGKGEVFCAVNLEPKNCLYTREGFDAGMASDYGYALMPVIGQGNGLSYQYVSRRNAAVMLDPNLLPKDGAFLGSVSSWNEWKLDDPKQLSPDGLLLTRLAENFIRVDADRLDGAFLVYRARSLVGENVSMRLQVNWHDANDAFLGAYLTVVQVQVPSKDYPAFISVPQTATHGYVYASLHDGATGKVLLESVRIVRLEEDSAHTGRSPQ